MPLDELNDVIRLHQSQDLIVESDVVHPVHSVWIPSAESLMWKLPVNTAELKYRVW